MSPIEHRGNFGRQLFPLRRYRSLVQRDLRRLAQELACNETELVFVEHSGVSAGIIPERLVEFGVPVVEAVEQRVDARKSVSERPVVRCRQVRLVVVGGRTRGGGSARAGGCYRA